MNKNSPLIILPKIEEQSNLTFNQFLISCANQFQQVRSIKKQAKSKFTQIAFGTNVNKQERIKKESPRRFYDRNYSQVDKQIRIPSLKNKKREHSPKRIRASLSIHDEPFSYSQNMKNRRATPNLFLTVKPKVKVVETNHYDRQKFPMTKQELTDSLLIILKKYQVPQKNFNLLEQLQ